MLESIRRLKDEGRFCDIAAMVPYASVIGLQCRIEDDGRLVSMVRHQPSNIGNTTLPAIHGGVIGALLEHSAVMQLLFETDIVSIPKIINLSVDYLRPAGPVDTFARGVVVKQGRRIANVRVEAWQGDPAKPVAAAHAHFLLGG